MGTIICTHFFPSISYMRPTCVVDLFLNTIANLPRLFLTRLIPSRHVLGTATVVLLYIKPTDKKYICVYDHVCVRCTE